MASKKEAVKSVNLPTRQAAFDWLLSNGYKIAKSTFYAKVADGFPALQKDGSMLITDLQRFARTIDRSLTAQDSSLQIRRETAETEKAEHDCRIAKTKADHAERRLSTEWAHREEVYTTWAALIGDLYTALTHNAGTSAGGIISACNGDPVRTRQATDAITAVIDASFNEVCLRTHVEGCFYAELDSDTPKPNAE